MKKLWDSEIKYSKKRLSIQGKALYRESLAQVTGRKIYKNKSELKEKSTWYLLFLSDNIKDIKGEGRKES